MYIRPDDGAGPLRPNAQPESIGIDVALFMLALFMPPVPIAVKTGLGKHFWVSIVLWLSMIPLVGPIHAWIVIITTNRRRARRHAALLANKITFPGVVEGRLALSDRLTDNQPQQRPNETAKPIQQEAKIPEEELKPLVQERPPLLEQENSPIPTEATEEPRPAIVRQPASFADKLTRTPSMLDTVHEQDEEVPQSRRAEQQKSMVVEEPTAEIVNPGEDGAKNITEEESSATSTVVPLERKGTIPPPSTPATQGDISPPPSDHEDAGEELRPEPESNEEISTRPGSSPKAISRAPTAETRPEPEIESQPERKPGPEPLAGAEDNDNAAAEEVPKTSDANVGEPVERES